MGHSLAALLMKRVTLKQDESAIAGGNQQDCRDEVPLDQFLVASGAAQPHPTRRSATVTTFHEIGEISNPTLVTEHSIIYHSTETCVPVNSVCLVGCELR